MGARLPAPGISSLVIEEGTGQFGPLANGMVRDIEEGLVVEQLMGGEQGNLLNGDFSGNVLLGYKVEHGNIAGRVKDTMISGNVYQVLQEIAGIGNESRWVDGIFRVPHLYCPRLSVSTRA
jgi:PmbA protein